MHSYTTQTKVMSVQNARAKLCTNLAGRKMHRNAEHQYCLFFLHLLLISALPFAVSLVYLFRVHRFSFALSVVSWSDCCVFLFLRYTHFHLSKLSEFLTGYWMLEHDKETNWTEWKKRTRWKWIINNTGKGSRNQMMMVISLMPVQFELEFSWNWMHLMDRFL